MALSQRLKDYVGTITGKYQIAALEPDSESFESADGFSSDGGTMDSEAKYFARRQNDDAFTAKKTTRSEIWTPFIVSAVLFLASFVFKHYVESTSDQACASLMETWSAYVLLRE